MKLVNTNWINDDDEYLETDVNQVLKAAENEL